MKKISLLSDTHSVLDERFIRHLKNSDEIWHAGDIGNSIMYVGAKTGRDGIHGASMASGSFDKESAKLKPTVQVGDPFLSLIHI